MWFKFVSQKENSLRWCKRRGRAQSGQSLADQGKGSEFHFKYEEWDPKAFKQKYIYRQQQITLLDIIY